MALSKKQANQISDLINSLLVQQQFIEERASNTTLFVQHAKWYNEAADKLAAIGITVNKYNLKSFEA